MLSREDLRTQFQDFEELTEFYYNELGKLSYIQDSLTKKERKKMRNYIVRMMFMRADVFFKQEKEGVKVDKSELDDFKSAFKITERQPREKPGIWTKVKNMLTKKSKSEGVLVSSGRAAQITFSPAQQEGSENSETS